MAKSKQSKRSSRVKKVLVEPSVSPAGKPDPSILQKGFKAKRYDMSHPPMGTPEGGPPKGMSWRELIRIVCSEPDLEGISRRENIVRRVAQLAEAGYLAACEFLADREEGKPNQPLSGPEGVPLFGFSPLDKSFAALAASDPELLRKLLKDLEGDKK